ncbi:hypothetical protein [Thalassoglobus sp.]|uniref:hypothetical protein n=1 Tax=Thalassoglobus sp. TaxID=2795869 RepID=UPI003AA7C805
MSEPKRSAHNLFSHGQIMCPPHALETISFDEIQQALTRHFSGDWGDCDPADAAANDLAVVEGTRLFSVYHDAHGQKFWIITEADRSATTVLRPADY